MMKPTKEQIQHYYTQALQRCLEAFAKLDEKEWNKKVNGWTAKDHLGHLAATTEAETMVLTRQALAGEPARIPGFEKREDIIPFREKCLENVRGLSTAELTQRLRAVVEEHLGILDSLSETDLDRPAMSPGWDRPGTIRDLFFASYLFLPGQYQEIRKVAKKKLPHWIEASTPEQVNYHMERVFQYMPLVFRSDKGGDMDVTYQFTMEGEGGGIWNIRIAEGKAEAGAGAADPFDAEIATKPQFWIDLANGDLNPVTAIMPGPLRKVKIAGNLGLAMKLSALFSVEE